MTIAAAAFIVSIFALIASIVSISITIWWNKMKVTFEVCDTFYCQLINLKVDEALKPIDPSPIVAPAEYFREHTADVYQILNLYEMVAQKVLKRYISEKIFKNFYYTIFTDAYRHLYPLLEAFKTSNPDRMSCYKSFESLHGRWTNNSK